LWGLYTLGLDREANDYFYFLTDLAEDNADLRAYLHRLLSPDFTVVLARDGKSYVYGSGWILSDLYLVTGLK